MPDQLPVLDISLPNKDVATHLVQAVSKYGFVYIKNHGLSLPPADIDAMFAMAKEFFTSPNEEKVKYAVNSHISGKNSGWFGMNTERLDPAKQSTGDFKEAINMNEFRNGKAQQPLPEPLASNEEYLNEFITKCHNICLKILELFALGLEIDTSSGGSEWFFPRHDPKLGSSGSVFRMLYYPKLPPGLAQNKDDLRCGSHSDYGTITLLFQREGEPGLEILTDEESNAWAPVPVNPTGENATPILVNVGDLLSFWTNGVLKSTVHRVTLPDPSLGKDRYSIAYFCHPLDSARLEPVPSKIIQGQAARTTDNGQVVHTHVMTAKEHLESRLQATYQ